MLGDLGAVFQEDGFALNGCCQEVGQFYELVS